MYWLYFRLFTKTKLRSGTSFWGTFAKYIFMNFYEISKSDPHLRKKYILLASMEATESPLKLMKNAFFFFFFTFVSYRKNGLI